MPQTATSQAKPQANSEETNLRYSGEFFDKDLNQQYLRARYYNQNNGQFNRLDPYSGNLSDPQSLHKYAYCHQDPVNHIDPSGNFSLVEVSITTTILFSLATGLFTGFHAWLNQKTSPLVAAVLGVIAAVVTFCGLFFAVQIAAFFGTFFLFATLTQQVIMCGVLAYGVSGVVEDMFEAVKIVSTKKPIGFFRRFVAAGFVLSILGDILLGGVKSGSKGAADDILRNTLDDAAEVAIESAATFGSSGSNKYRDTFFGANSSVSPESTVVHHAVEQQVMKRYSDVVSASEIHSLENLRGIPKDINSDIHLSKIRKLWNKFYKDSPNPSKQDLLDQAQKIDDEFGHLFTPPIRKQ